MAQHEAKAISERTKSALTAKVERLKANGEPTNWRVDSKTGEIAKWTNDARVKGIAAIKEKAANNENIQRAKDVAKMLRENGNTLEQIADYLNKRKFTTSKGMQFQKTSVMRLLA
jgi:DNA invertase Pin-like site-specific DNA recombinase